MMLAVLLKILAAIGIFLLALLGIVLVVILIVLFVPITYKIKGKMNENVKEVSVRIKWLFGIVRFSLDYSQKLTYRVKILWFDLTDKLNSKSKDVEKESPVPNKKDAEPIQENTVSDPAANNCTVNHSVSESADPTPDSCAQDSAKEPPKKNLLFKIQTICDKIKEIYENISYYLDLIRQDDTKHLIAHCLNVLLNILKSIRPRKLVLNIKFGFDEPDTTGKIYGLLCMLYPYYGNDIHIEPDFEKKILLGNVYLKGRIFICVLLINALRILLDRKLYKVIHKLKNGGKGNGR